MSVSSVNDVIRRLATDQRQRDILREGKSACQRLSLIRRPGMWKTADEMSGAWSPFSSFLFGRSLLVGFLDLSGGLLPLMPLGQTPEVKQGKASNLADSVL